MPKPTQYVGTGKLCPAERDAALTLARHPVDGNESGSASVSNVDLVNAGDTPTWFLLDTSKVVKPFILQIRKDYKFISLDKDENEHVFKRGEYVYGVEDRLNAGFGLWQLAFTSNKPLTADNIAAADATMMSLKSPAGKPLGIAGIVRDVDERGVWVEF
ncbi:hypothetical protein AGMMS50225_22270 [Betaproteobacteria bacterium]|nr:hypothetical protein AGMMS50225_22270 [Betaproteobacteria bacterium]